MVEPGAQPFGPAAVALVEQQCIPTAAPLPGEADVEGNGGFPWLAVVGSLFILAAVGIFAVQRLRT